ncbi:MAG TPA: DUF2336 domain-containing protein [Pseudolabrys sp.]|jgi:uncharacterized protein (DUF2336 family)|nr:DUF2336 domain-containing protein [Pseudolabrys sp.]
MNVRQFLQWIRTAPAGERADATAALARAYLHSELSTDDLAAAEGAMIMLLDDPSPLVRRALSEAVAGSEKAPPIVVHALAAEQADIAIPVLSRSPLLLDVDLVDLVATSQPDAQSAIAMRRPLSRAVAAAIAEVGPAQACLALLENPEADITFASMDRIADRFGHLAPIRENLLARADLPIALRQTLLTKLSATLAGFVASRRWLGEESAQQAVREACEKATVALAAETPYDEIGDLVRHLRESGQLTAGMLLRALLSGNVVLFEEALAELSGVSIDRVVSFVHDKNISGFSALYRKAGLPDAVFPAFREAVMALREMAWGEQGDSSRLKRRLTERVLTRCALETDQRIEPVLVLLRRFVVEAAREEARMFCDELVAAGDPADDASDRVSIAEIADGSAEVLMSAGATAAERNREPVIEGAAPERMMADEDPYPVDDIVVTNFDAESIMVGDMTTGEAANEHLAANDPNNDLRLVA